MEGASKRGVVLPAMLISLWEGNPHDLRSHIRGMQKCT